jgi:hypothetical protein
MVNNLKISTKIIKNKKKILNWKKKNLELILL